MIASRDVQDLISIPQEKRDEAYVAMRSDLDSDWVHVPPSALRNRFQSASKRLESDNRTRVRQGKDDIERINSDIENYERKSRLKHLMSVLSGSWDSVLIRPNFEFTVRYSHHPDWNAEAAFVASFRTAEIQGAQS